jgi:acyl-[acyl-carrier-protein]-phospholipid O-acyltransferase / long-chain-fatty-acid--[acyl-carrier-protein] ligase
MQTFPHGVASRFMPGEPSTELDDEAAAQELPIEVRDGGSLPALIIVQMLNSFSDNLVKMLVIVFAGTVGAGTFLGDKMQVCMGIVFSLPYIFLAPLAGWVSDHFSKQRVIFWMQICQIFIFFFFYLVISLRLPQVSLILCLVGVLFLAMEAAMFSPARLGIIKELAGARGLGLASGVQQFSMFGAILFSYWLAGKWFGTRLEHGADPWGSAQLILGFAIALAVLQAAGALLVRRTPAHPEVAWRRELALEHFVNLRLVFQVRTIGIAALGIVFFWFTCNAVGAMLVGLCNEQYSDLAAAAKLKGTLSALLGVGIMAGILLATVLSRKRIELRLVPAAALLLGITMLWVCFLPARDAGIYPLMIGIGLGAGAFMVPLYAFIQDRSLEHQRARVLSGVGLIDCLGSSVANFIVMGLLIAKIPSTLQLGAMGILSLITAVGMLKLVFVQKSEESAG